MKSKCWVLGWGYWYVVTPTSHEPLNLLRSWQDKLESTKYCQPVMCACPGGGLCLKIRASK